MYITCQNFMACMENNCLTELNTIVGLCYCCVCVLMGVLRPTIQGKTPGVIKNCMYFSYSL